ncbi:hypothetical protein RU639_013526 [Aspergillus parasiticus]
MYNDPLDDTGIDLSEIPEDFDKAEGTIVRRERIEGRWKRYCISRTRLEPKVQKWRDPEEALRQASNNDMYRFLGWCLKLERGEKCRHLKGIHKSSSLEADWKNLRGYHQRPTKTRINDHDGSEVRRGLKYLVHENELDTQPAKKTPGLYRDIGPFNKTILSTQEKKFHLGFQRIQFKDLQISLQKDPRGGPAVRLIELTASGTKKFLGQTKLTTFALPEVIYGPSLVLCPYTLIFGILFQSRAFRNPNLTSNTKLRNLFISKGCEQLLVPIDSGQTRIHQRDKEVKNTRQRLLRALRQQVREKFDEEQAFLDIEAQLSGIAVKEESEDEESSLQDDMHPLPLLLLQRLLSYPTSNSVEDEWKRRDDAVDAVVQYCGVLEGGPLRGRPKQITAKSIPMTASEPDFDGSSDTRDDLGENLGTILSPRDELFCATQNHLGDTSQTPRACFQCFANEKLPGKTRCKIFYDAGCVTRHFDAHHLREDPLKCNYCEVFLVHKMAFQCHASGIHRVESRWRESRDVR